MANADNDFFALFLQDENVIQIVVLNRIAAVLLPMDYVIVVMAHFLSMERLYTENLVDVAQGLHEHSEEGAELVNSY